MHGTLGSERYRTVPPDATQEDFIFYSILRAICSQDKLLDEPLIPYWPDSFHIPCLIRFLAGGEDFACRGDPYQSRKKMSFITRSVANHSGLVCLCSRKVVIEDTE